MKMAENRCVCCGEQIPEGTQVCPHCKAEADGYARQVDKKNHRKAVVNQIMWDWVYPIGLVILILVYFMLVMRG